MHDLFHFILKLALIIYPSRTSHSAKQKCTTIQLTNLSSFELNIFLIYYKKMEKLNTINFSMHVIFWRKNKTLENNFFFQFEIHTVTQLIIYLLSVKIVNVPAWYLIACWTAAIAAASSALWLVGNFSLRFLEIFM